MNDVWDEMTDLPDEVLREELERASKDLSWLNTFEKGDLIEMITEVIDLLGKDILTPEHKVANLIATVYEWHESAIVTQSGILAEAMAEPSDPVPLTPPEEIERRTLSLPDSLD